MAASVVHFKFKSSLVKDSVTFDGHYISVGELKRLIAAKKGLGPEGGAELEVSDWNTRAAYANDAEQIPRNTSVIVRRVPAAKARPGLGNRAGVAAPGATATAAGPVAALPAALTAARAGSGAPGAGGGAADDFGGDVFDAEAAAKAARQEEDALISAHLDAQAQQWRGETEATVLQDRERAAQRAARGRGRFAGRGGGGPNRPHEGYFCRHCGAHALHFHEDCPTKDNPPKELRTVRAPAGIPVTLLDRSRQQGNLLLPDGKTGGLRHHEDVFAREMGALPTAGRGRPLALTQEGPGQLVLPPPPEDGGGEEAKASLPLPPPPQQQPAPPQQQQQPADKPAEPQQQAAGQAPAAPPPAKAAHPQQPDAPPAQKPAGQQQQAQAPAAPAVPPVLFGDDPFGDFDGGPPSQPTPSAGLGLGLGMGMNVAPPAAAAADAGAPSGGAANGGPQAEGAGQPPPPGQSASPAGKQQRPRSPAKQQQAPGAWRGATGGSWQQIS
jgi:hypothetical protein